MTHAKILRNDRKGGIEGLPMELLIIIVVATIGTGILVGWMGNLDGQSPTVYGDVTSDVTMVSTDGKLYGTNGNEPCADTSFAMTVTVRDSNGDSVSDAVVTLSGADVSGTKIYGQTDSTGKITFEGLTVGKPSSSHNDYIKVNISSDLGDKTLKIPVVAA